MAGGDLHPLPAVGKHCTGHACLLPARDRGQRFGRVKRGLRQRRIVSYLPHGPVRRGSYRFPRFIPNPPAQRGGAAAAGPASISSAFLLAVRPSSSFLLSSSLPWPISFCGSGRFPALVSGARSAVRRRLIAGCGSARVREMGGILIDLAITSELAWVCHATIE